MVVVDPDDLGTWPEGLAEAVRQAEAERLNYDPDKAIRATLGERRLLAYHATRLLDEEIEDIRLRGMYPADQDLVRRRVTAAVGSGHLTLEDATALIDGNLVGPLAGCSDDSRPGQICFFLTRGHLREQLNGANLLLSNWGGEIIYMSKAGEERAELLRSIGRPAIVVAALPVTLDIDIYFTSLAVAFEAGSAVDMHWRGGPVSPAHILDIWTPGHPDYDSHLVLPRD